MVWYKRPIVSYIGVGVFLGVGFVLPVFWWLSAFGVAYQVHLLLTRVGKWWHSFFAWTVKYLFVISWGLGVYPIDWLGTSLGVFEIPAIVLYWLSTSMILGVGGVLFYFLFEYLYRTTSRLITYISAPFLWLGAELFSALLFSLITYGEGATIGAQFSFGYIGYHLAQHQALILFAHILGVYSLTIVLVGLSIIGLILLRQKKYVLSTGLVVCIVASEILYSPTQFISPEDDTIEIAVVSTELFTRAWQSAELWELRQQTLLEALKAAEETQAPYMLFPEDSRLLSKTTEGNSLKTISEMEEKKSEVVIVDTGKYVTEKGNSVLRAFVYDVKNQSTTLADKGYLVPQGEFTPALHGSILSVLGSDAKSYMDNMSVFSRGELVSQSHFTEKLPSVLFCFESVDPWRVRELLTERKSDVPFIAHVVSHGWFQNSRILQVQLNSMLKVHAVWNQVPIVVAGNHARSVVYTPAGEIILPVETSSGINWSVGVIEIPQ